MGHSRTTKTEGGHKKGRSNMEHFITSTEIKAGSKIKRRQEDRQTQ